MRHTTADEELTGQAALYALGALGEAEARAFERHVSEGCEACAAELKSFEAVVQDLGLSAPPADPPEGVCARLLALVTEADALDEPKAEPPRKATGAGFLVVRAEEGRWVETDDEGVSYKLLYADAARGTVTTLVRMLPGSHITAHRHLGVEQCLVLEGDVRSGDVRMKAGDFNCSLPGSIHQELSTDGGALLLLVSPERYEAISG